MSERHPLWQPRDFKIPCQGQMGVGGQEGKLSTWLWKWVFLACWKQSLLAAVEKGKPMFCNQLKRRHYKREFCLPATFLLFAQCGCSTGTDNQHSFICFWLDCNYFLSTIEHQQPSLAHQGSAGGPHLVLLSNNFFQANKTKINPSSPLETPSAALESLPYVQMRFSLPR